jgi:hypothetical protein
MIKPRFGSVVVFDLGASNPKQGNLRVNLLTDDGKPLGEAYKGPVAENGFSNGQDMIQGIAEKITLLYKKNRHALPQNDTINAIAGNAIAGFVSSPCKAGYVTAFKNLRTRQNGILKNTDFNTLPNQLTGVPLAKNVNLMIANDMMGGVVELVNQLEKKPIHLPFKAGLSWVYTAIGGGFGVAEFHHSGQYVDVKTTESGNIPLFHQPGTLESTAASVSALVGHFTHLLPLDVRQTGAVDKLTPMAITHYAEAKKLLPALTRKQHNYASLNAIQAYAEALAKLFCIKVLEGTQVGFISGPLNRGIEAYVNQNPTLFSNAAKGKLPGYLEAIKPNLFHRLIYTAMLQHRSVAQDIQMTQNQFQLNTDFVIDDNTKGGYRVTQGQLVGADQRSSWLKLPVQS